MDDNAARCLAHLEAAEAMLDAAGDLASLARLALVIDLLRRRQGLPDRVLDADVVGF